MSRLKNKDVILEISFDMENIDCIAYQCVSLSYWKIIQNTLLTRSDIRVQVHSNPSPIEIYGEEYLSSRLIKDIKVITDPKKVEAFKTFHGESFYTGFDFFSSLFEQVNLFQTSK